MKVCFFGSYERSNYNMLLKKILEKQNVEVIECHADINGIGSLILSYLKLWRQHRKLEYDILFIPWRGIISFPLAKLVSKKPIVYLAFISIYDTLVNDRKLYKPNSIVGKFIHLVDKLSCKWSDMVITESFASRDYFINEFGVDPDKFRRLFLSADEEKFPLQSLKKPTRTFNVLFFGTFIPLHGIYVILKAAHILKDRNDIKFEICGKGQLAKQMLAMKETLQLDNVEFLGFVPHDTLQEKICQSDVCLGIFNGGTKAQNVVTNKVFQILSSGRALITMDSKAIKEIGAESGKNCILVPPECPEKLAEAIIMLKNSPEKLFHIAQNGNDLFCKKLDMDKTGQQLLSYLNELKQN